MVVFVYKTLLINMKMSEFTQASFEELVGKFGYSNLRLKLINPVSTKWEERDWKQISIALCRIFDEIGFSEKKRNRHIERLNITDFFTGIILFVENIGHQVLTVGGEAEATHSNELFSDIDQIIFNNELKAYDKIQHNKDHLLMVREPDTAPGYVKLQLVNSGKIVSDSSYLKENYQGKFVKDKHGNYVLWNPFHLYHNNRNSTGSDWVSFFSGPAITCHIKNYIDRRKYLTDIVRAYLCPVFPNLYKNWFLRQQKSNMFDEAGLQHMEAFGCILVPTGSPYSPEKDLEWRISFTFQERYIMQNLNPVQYKCYVLIKFIKKCLIEREVCGVISSYHLKTALFYVIEMNNGISWDESDLLKNTIACIKLLLKWVKDENVPNFFIPGENMIAHKLQNRGNKYKLEEYLEHLLANNLSMICEIEKVHLGLRIQHEIMSLGHIPQFDQSENNILMSFFTNDKIEAILEIIKNAKDIVDTTSFLRNILLLKHRACSCQEAIEGLVETTDNILCLKYVLVDLENSNEDTRFISTTMLLTWLMVDLEILKRSYINDRLKVDLLTEELHIFYVTEYPSEHTKTAIKITLSILNTLIAGYLSVWKVNQNNLSDTEKGIILKLLQLLKFQSDKHEITHNVQDLSMRFFHLAGEFEIVNSGLKQATVFLINGEKDKFKQIIDVLNMHFRRRVIVNCCICIYEKPDKLSEIWCYEQITAKQIRERGKYTLSQESFEHVVHCVAFSRAETEITPNPLVYEFYKVAPPGSKSMHEEEDNRTVYFGTDSLLKIAIADAPVYLYLLNHMYYHSIGDIRGSNKALNNIENVIIRNSALPHKDTALNILGYMYKQKGWIRLAILCFKASLAISHDSNAARWHLFVTVGTLLKQNMSV